MQPTNIHFFSSLQTSKTLNYLDSPITGPYFAFFIGVWTYLRHYINLRILWTVWTEFATVGPFELNWETQQYKCWISQIIAFFLLSLLQGVNLFWLVLILRIAWRFVTASALADERSEDEAEAEAAEMEEEEKIAERKDKGLDGNGSAAVANGRPKVFLNGTPFEEEAVLLDDEKLEKEDVRRRR